VKAVILAAGKGTRMGGLTTDIPKPMLQVQGRPILEHILTGLRDAAGIREFFIVTGHRAEVVEAHFGDGSKFGVAVRYGRQVVQRFGENGFDGVVTVTGSQDVTQGGLFFFDEAFCLNHLVEKPSQAQLEQLRAEGRLKPGATAWYNAGIYVFRPSVYDFTARLQKSPRGEYELTDALSAMIAAGQKLAGLQIAGRWVDVRDPSVLAKVEAGEV
jgi:UDP-N-acetylglucosamine diphosphorylase / glucose-1-phosphate thymidylyltransferase / UDP-N-acetylgalactosamine diphosphorylase / glucosamine-1-phosphate N-acetyltransferase / galactosamine-1-phosphate N-acetyltransferase